MSLVPDGAVVLLRWPTLQRENGPAQPVGIAGDVDAVNAVVDPEADPQQGLRGPVGRDHDARGTVDEQDGTGPRAPVSGPRFVNTDFSAVKNFPFHESMNLQFRAEFFNLFNHSQFYLTGDGGFGFMQNIASPTSFGKVNATVNNPRVIQFALKLKF